MPATKKLPPKKAAGKKAANTGTANEWAKKSIAGVRKKQRGTK